jgi:hypothetical protein
MELLEFARGPGLVFALAVFVAGLGWRIYAVYRRPAKSDLSEPRSTATAAGGARAIVSRMWHHETFRSCSSASCRTSPSSSG